MKKLRFNQQVYIIALIIQGVVVLLKFGIKATFLDDLEIRAIHSVFIGTSSILLATDTLEFFRLNSVLLACCIIACIGFIPYAYVTNGLNLSTMLVTLRNVFGSVLLYGLLRMVNDNDRAI